MMNAAHDHHFRIHVERMDNATVSSLIFEIRNNDDIFAFVERVREGTAFSSNNAAALAIGLKLLTGVMLDQRHDPLFADIQPAIRMFIGNLKSRIAAMTQRNQQSN
jgi:hypothetical protein